MLQPTDTSEKALQKLIVKHLVDEHKYRETDSNEFDREFCLNYNELMEFIRETQVDAYNQIQAKGNRNFLVRVDKKIQELGVIGALRKGISYQDKTVFLYYPEPNSTYNRKDLVKYEANIFSVTQELIYTDNNKNRLDLTICLNGLPILTMELKNAFTYQAVQNAIKQYMYDRNPKDKLFNLGRCMVHFAVDTTQIYMAGSLAGPNTVFFPFNKGQNDGKPQGPFGAGNPINPNGIKTSYLWEEILAKNSLANIVEKFATLLSEKNEETGKVKQIQIFPRYHQLNVVREILKDAKAKGVGQRYLIQHSAGSGKTNSISWLAHQLVGLFSKDNTTPLFDSVLVVTDRIVLDEQIRKNIKQFAQVKKVVEGITGNSKDIKELDPTEENFSKSTHMRLALANNKKIITCTVGTFPFALKGIQDMQTKNVAIIIDEAHSSQSGEAAASMNALFADINADELPKDEEGNISTEDLLNYLVESRKMLPNASYFAFTATPKNKTSETFGIPVEIDNGDGTVRKEFYPFHSYSMKQAIEEEFILDVLQNYTTIKSYYKIKKDGTADEYKIYETIEANKKIRSYVEGHETAIKDKAKIMVDHFNQHVRMRIGNKAKAMVACKSIESAMKYKEAIDSYLKEINSPFNTIVAFSGKKKHWATGIELTEEKMNDFADGINDIPMQFKKDENRFLIVANKYQTGFDEPLLHTMYVDKQLSDIQAVQTLSRLNRAKKPEKKETFVLDFFNSADDIQRAFQPYYTTTILSNETDADKLNDLQDDLDGVQIYDEEIVTEFFKDYYDKTTDRSKLDSLIDKVVRNFNEDLIKDQQIEFKGNAKSFVRTYSYLSRIISFNKPYWEMLWLFLKHLLPHLKIEEDKDEDNILEAIDMASYRSSTIAANQQIVLEGNEGYINPIPVSKGGGSLTPDFEDLATIVDAFNRRFGDIDWGEGVSKEDAEDILTNVIPKKLEEDKDALLAILNSDKSNAREESNNLVKGLMQGMMFTNTAIYKKYADDDNFRSRYQEFIFDVIWMNSTQLKNQQRIDK
jgi:type I restriction enzyme R subunit